MTAAENHDEQEPSGRGQPEGERTNTARAVALRQGVRRQERSGVERSDRAGGAGMTEEGQQQPAWRRALDRRTPGWCHESGVHWESWSLNGEACITGLDPPFTGGARLANCLTWLVRSFARHCRPTH